MIKKGNYQSQAMELNHPFPSFSGLVEFAHCSHRKKIYW